MTIMGMSVWVWVAGLLALVILLRTKGTVRGGVMVILLTLLVARLLYVWLST